MLLLFSEIILRKVFQLEIMENILVQSSKLNNQTINKYKFRTIHKDFLMKHFLIVQLTVQNLQQKKKINCNLYAINSKMYWEHHHYKIEEETRLPKFCNNIQI